MSGPRTPYHARMIKPISPMTMTVPVSLRSAGSSLPPGDTCAPSPRSAGPFLPPVKMCACVIAALLLDVMLDTPVQFASASVKTCKLSTTGTYQPLFVNQ
eukprot:8552088-Karenia_brevis.AAC.1